MPLASKANPHLMHYDREVLDGALSRIDKTADDFLFGLLHGKRRQEYATNFMGVRITYDQLDAKIEQVARALFAYGVRQGDYITIVLPNVTQCVEYIYACWRIGAIANLIDPRTNSQGILERTQRTDSKLLVTLMDICNPKIDDILDELPPVIVVSPSDSLQGSMKLKPVLGRLIYSVKMKKFAEGRWAEGGKYMWHRDFINSYSTDLEDIRAVYSPDLPAVIHYTSGTTSDGLMKGTVVTHRAFNAALCAFRYSVRPEEYQRGFTFGGFIPFFAAYGAICGMHASLCGGLEILLVPIFDPTKFAELLLRIKPNIFLGVPRFHEQLAEHPKLQKKSNRLSFIKIAISGGDKISMASLERINATFARNGYNGGLRVGYGSTELGGSIAVMPYYEPGDANEAFPWKTEGNVGILLPHCRAMVIDPDTGEELPIGQAGELCVYSLSQMERYLNLPEETQEITHIGPDGTKYFRMGDKGHLDENGCFFFLDRYKRSLMRPDGHTVHPSPIENVIMGHEAVEMCAVVGLRLSDETAGAIPSAFVILREGYDTPEQKLAALQDIDRHCLKLLPERDRAIAYKVVEELPYTLMGKIHFRKLEEQLFDPSQFLITDFAFFPELRPGK